MKEALKDLPGRVDEDYEAVGFSPAGPNGRVIDNLNLKLNPGRRTQCHLLPSTS
jgi:hypothetical protein